MQKNRKKQWTVCGIINKGKQQDRIVSLNHVLCDQVMQRWYVVQQELIPDVLEQTGV